MERSSAVVIGLHENGLGVVRALAREGVSVIAVDGDLGTAYAATRYARKVFCPDFRGPGLIEGLSEIGEQLDTPGVLIPTMDRSVLLISDNRTRIEPFFLHSLPEDAKVQLLMNKAATRKYAEAQGFCMPHTFEIHNEDDLEACIEDMQKRPALQLPCILKPKMKTVMFVQYSPKKAFFIHSVDELRQTYQMVSQWEREVVVQEWIPGPDMNLIFCLYYFNSQSEPIAWFTARKLRQHIPYCGTACSAEPWEDHFVRDEGIRFFQGINYRGFGAIEFKKDTRDGTYYLMEPTVGRTEHLFALAAANGVNLPYIGYRDMAGLPPLEWKQNTRPTRYLNLGRDFMAASIYRRSGELSVWQWLKSMRGGKQHALFAWDDPGPFLNHVMRRLTGKPRKAVGKFTAIAKSIGEQASFYIGSSSKLWEPQTNATHIQATIDWLCAAQDATDNGGVARGYSFRSTPTFSTVGWQPPYPETTGYIIPTFFDCAKYGQHILSPEMQDKLRDRAIRMADWEIEVQLPNGGIQGGVLGDPPSPVVFNTGQVLLGWCRAYKETGDANYLRALQRAAAFLVEIQDKGGGWRRFSSRKGDFHIRAHHVRVSWALLRVNQITGDDASREAAIRNIEFTLKLQQPNGWYRSNDLQPEYNQYPLTHTIAYATRGLLESGMILNEPRYIAAAKTAADAVLERLQPRGYLPGQFDADWKPAARWCCLTGNAQMAIIWLKFYQLTGDSRYLHAAQQVNHFLKATQDLQSSNSGIRGGIAGCYPIHGHYGRYQYLNWAAKFFIDALLLEEKCCGEVEGQYEQPIY